MDSTNAGQKIAAKSKELMNYIKKKDASWLAQAMLMIIIAAVVIGMFSYTTNKFRLRSANCYKMDRRYTTDPNSLIKSPPRWQDDYSLRDFYIKTAHNCCSGGSFKNSYVDLCHLRTAIKQGVRCLDFEIYSIDNKPRIATSSLESYNYKETYNSIAFSEAMNEVRKMAFSGNAPNQHDLMLIHLRVKSTNKEIYKEMARNLHSVFGGFLLPNMYGRSFDGDNLGKLPVKELKRHGKVIVIVDQANKSSYMDTPFYDYVNMISGSPNMRLLRNRGITTDLYNHEELTNFNRQNMSIVLPELSTVNTNPKINIAHQYGCQMVAMNLSKDDGLLEFYEGDRGFKNYAFKLKPKSLRFNPIKIREPSQADVGAALTKECVEAAGVPGGKICLG